MKSHVKPTQPKNRLTLLAIALIASLGTLTACGEKNNESTASKAPAEIPKTETQPTETQPKADTEPQPETKTEAQPADAPKADEAPQAEAKTEDVQKTEEKTDKKEEILAADAGQKLYDSTCHTCHATGLLDAPKLGDKAAWQPRIAKGKETLYKHSAKGFNKMPPQAIGDISEAQVHAAVDYILEKSS